MPLPMIDLVEQSSQAIDELIDVVGRRAVEAVLQLSTQGLIGAKSQGRKVARENDVQWHGRQSGSVALSDRKLRVARPRPGFTPPLDQAQRIVVFICGGDTA